MGARSAYRLSSLTRRMPIEGFKDSPDGINDGGDVESHELRKCLTVRDVIAYGVGSTVGAGIFVITGPGARASGPAIVLAFVLSSFSCLLSALGYAEFASRVPISGSAYSFTYVALGELSAWFIGWNLTLEYMISAAAVARGWSSNLLLFFSNIGGHPPEWLDQLHLFGNWTVSPLSAAICVACTLILLLGVKESARFNMFVTVLNVVVILFIIILGSTKVDTANWTRAATAAELHLVPDGCSADGGFLPCGFNGLLTGAAKVFFSYVGFDAVTTLAEEVKNPQRDMPLGVLGTLGIATSLYVGASLVVTGMQPWFALDPNTPLASAFNAYGLGWASTIIAAITVTGLTATTLCSLFGQPRIFHRMSRDGLLLKAFGKVHSKTQIPVFGTIVTGIGAGLIAFSLSLDSLSEMISIGTLLAFSTVCAGVVILRYQSEERPRQAIYLILWFAIAVVGLCAALRRYQDVPAWAIGILGAHALAPVIWLATLPVASLPATFCCPLVPFLPCLGIFTNMYLICSLNWESYVRVAAWTVLGLLNYLFYGIVHSRLNDPLLAAAAVPGGAMSYAAGANGESLRAPLI